MGPSRDRDLLEIAKRGAKAQLNDLVHEVTMLFDLFPHLRDSVDPDELPLLFLLKQGSAKPQPKGAPASARAMKTARPAPVVPPRRARKKTPTKG